MCCDFSQTEPPTNSNTSVGNSPDTVCVNTTTTDNLLASWTVTEDSITTETVATSLFTTNNSPVDTKSQPIVLQLIIGILVAVIFLSVVCIIASVIALLYLKHRYKSIYSMKSAEKSDTENFEVTHAQNMEVNMVTNDAYATLNISTERNEAYITVNNCEDEVYTVIDEHNHTLNISTERNEAYITVNNCEDEVYTVIDEHNHTRSIFTNRNEAYGTAVVTNEEKL